MNSTDKPLSAGLMQQDAYEVVTFLLKRFTKEKSFWYRVHGDQTFRFHLAQKHPDLLYAYIPVSPIIDQERAMKLTKEMLLEWSVKNKDSVAITEVNKIHVPHIIPDDLYYTSKWLFIHNEVDFVKAPEFKCSAIINSLMIFVVQSHRRASLKKYPK
jgi:hypothetical protein